MDAPVWQLQQDDVHILKQLKNRLSRRPGQLAASRTLQRVFWSNKLTHSQGFIRHRNEKILPIFVERVRNVSYILSKNALTISSMIKDTSHARVVGIDHVKICSFTSFIPSIRLMTQNRLSLKYEKIIAPRAADCAAL
ncbi:hypothetical protein AA906_15495 [Geobacillus stearothermophilus]|nr:hypothetical protein AA906_15495 [Geobacillus stearothermophilus]